MTPPEERNRILIFALDSPEFSLHPAEPRFNGKSLFLAPLVIIADFFLS
jgi:hypothetical protein